MLEGGKANHRNVLAFTCGIKPNGPHVQRDKARKIIPKLVFLL